MVLEPKSAAPDLAHVEGEAKSVFKAAKLTGTPEVSETRKAVASAPADWIVCLRSTVPPFRPYAMFFKGNELITYRIAVLYDDCAREMYVQVVP